MVTALDLSSTGYDYYVVGSDQVWLPSNLFSAYFSLRFVPNNILKISYASSLGVSHYPWYYHAIAKDSWKRFDHISVREKEGGQIIKKICNNKFFIGSSRITSDISTLNEVRTTIFILRGILLLVFFFSNSSIFNINNYCFNHSKSGNSKNNSYNSKHFPGY